MFEDLRLRWDGRDYVIPRDQITMAAAVVENTCTLDELCGFLARQAVPYAKVSCIYADLLRFAGKSDVSANDVFARMFEAGGAMQRDAAVVVQYIVERMLPKGLAFPEAPSEGNAPADEPSRSSARSIGA
jgi:hypothetical protein